MAKEIRTQEDRDFVLGQIDAKVDQLLEHRALHDTRIASLEKQIWWGKGALAIAILAFFERFRDLVFSLHP